MNLLIHDINVADYRSRPGVAQSQLKHLSKSPAHFRYALDHPGVVTPAMEFGTLCDHLLFGTPFDWTPSPYDDYRKAEARDWRDRMQAQGTTVIKPEVVTSARDLVASVLRRRTVSETLLSSGNAQVALFADIDGVQCKGLADWICSDKAIIADLKTTGKTAAATTFLGDDETEGFASDAAWARTVINMEYDLQAAFYVDLYAAITGEAMGFWWIVAEAHPPYEVAVWVATADVLSRGRKLYKQRLAMFKECTERDEWPGYPDRPQFVNLPAWAK